MNLAHPHISQSIKPIEKVANNSKYIFKVQNHFIIT